VSAGGGQGASPPEGGETRCVRVRTSRRQRSHDSPKKSDVYCIERKPKTSKNIHIQSYALLLI